MTERIFDAHTHIFPEKIAEKAVANIGKFYDLKMNYDGTSEGLLAGGATIGCEKYVVCSVATTPRQVESINNFVAGECEKHREFIGLGSIHPDYENVAAETDRIIGMGLKGIKLHPDFQLFNIDDEAAYPIYEAAEGRVPILFHTGDDRHIYSDPRRLEKVLDRFPKLIAIAAHLGGYMSWDKIEGISGHPRVYFDTSSALDFMTPDKADEIIHRHGIDRILFGTDSPMWTHEEEFARFNKLTFTAEERKAVLWDNAARLYGITD